MFTFIPIFAKIINKSIGVTDAIKHDSSIKVILVVPGDALYWCPATADHGGDRDMVNYVWKYVFVKHRRLDTSNRPKNNNQSDSVSCCYKYLLNGACILTL